MTLNRLNGLSQDGLPRGKRHSRPGWPTGRAVLIPQGLYVYFDLPLIPMPIATANWRARVNGRWLTLHNGTAYPNRCQFQTGQGDFAAGGNQVSYLATVPDVQGIDLQYVQRFIAFPITLT